MFVKTVVFKEKDIERNGILPGHVQDLSRTSSYKVLILSVKPDSEQHFQTFEARAFPGFVQDSAYVFLDQCSCLSSYKRVYIFFTNSYR